MEKFCYLPWGIVIGTTIIVIVIIISCIKYQFFKVKTMTENDAKYKKFNDDGKPSREGYVRPVWDYSFFPEFSRIWHQREWPLAIASLLLLILFCAYLITNRQEFYNLLNINFGVLIGALIQVGKEKSEKQQ